MIIIKVEGQRTNLTVLVVTKRQSYQGRLAKRKKEKHKPHRGAIVDDWQVGIECYPLTRRKGRAIQRTDRYTSYSKKR